LIFIISKSKLLEIHEKKTQDNPNHFDILGSPITTSEPGSPIMFDQASSALEPPKTPSEQGSSTAVGQASSAVQPRKLPHFPLATQNPTSLMSRTDLQTKLERHFPFPLRKLLSIDQAEANRKIVQAFVNILDELIEMSKPKSWNKKFNIENIKKSEQYNAIRTFDPTIQHSIDQFLDFLNQKAQPTVQESIKRAEILKKEGMARPKGKKAEAKAPEPTSDEGGSITNSRKQKNNRKISKKNTTKTSRNKIVNYKKLSKNSILNNKTIQSKRHLKRHSKKI
jgi:hypothetical protein